MNIAYTSAPHSEREDVLVQQRGTLPFAESLTAIVE
jgi:hypothetical protein